MAVNVKISFYRKYENGIAQDYGMSVFEKSGKLFRLDEGTEFFPDNTFLLEDTVEVTQESFKNIMQSLRGLVQ